MSAGRGRAETRGEERREGIPLGSVFGVPVSLAWSWFVVAAFIVAVFSPDVAAALPGIGILGACLVALAYAVLLALSVLVHELAHALSAKAFGWPGARIVLTLWGGHTQFGSFNATPGRSLLVAMAGPAANFILAGIGFAADLIWAPSGVAGLLLGILVWANFLVALFNVLPGLPLDGGRLVESAVWRGTGSQERGTLAAGWAGRAIAVGIAGYFLLLPALRGQEPDLQLIVVAVLIAGFLWSGASASIANARLRLRVPHVAVRDLMQPASALPSDVHVADIDRHLMRRPPGHVVLVSAEGVPEAVVDAGSLGAVPAHLRGTTPASTVARALAPGAVVSVDEVGKELIDRLAGIAGSEYAVLDGGTVVGLLFQGTVVDAVTKRR
ncbi:peptidase M50 [Zafaria cholistanensis]|uniref:Zinc metalloprotease n=1 Tax=Zafaria cholistanensis TaxID=1682741 RepID=A0A5A7NMF1_9MICC|nr:site-2 protease family protein [Zafaria cholistanensis]GER22085.1 peptidase M50 [Zafaria cholistanensis]